MEGSKDNSAGVCTCGRKAKSRSQRFCVPVAKEATSRCPCVSNNRKCRSKCRCLNCENREKNYKPMSCRCGESQKKSELEGTGRKYCTNVEGKRQTKCGCYKNRQPCSSLCACYECANDFGEREVSTNQGPTHFRKRKMTSSPPSLKRVRTMRFLQHSGCEVQTGQWTMEETCLLDSVESFLHAASMLAISKNIATLYNYVIKSQCAVDLNVKANAKTTKQIQGKLDFEHNRRAALENLFYGISNLDN